MTFNCEWRHSSRFDSAWSCLLARSSARHAAQVEELSNTETTPAKAWRLHDATLKLGKSETKVISYTRSSSREVRIRVPLLGEPSQPKKKR